MKITYKNKKIKKECNDPKIRVKKYGDDVSYKLFKLLILIENSPSFNDVYMFPQYHAHKLKGELKNEYSLVISRRSKYRLIVFPFDDLLLELEDDDLDALQSLKSLKIIEVSPHYE